MKKMLSFVSEKSFFDAQTNHRHTVVVFEGLAKVPCGGEMMAAISVSVSCNVEQAENFKRKRDVLFTFDEQVAAPTVLAATVVPPQEAVQGLATGAAVGLDDPSLPSGSPEANADPEAPADSVPKTRTRKSKA